MRAKSSSTLWARAAVLLGFLGFTASLLGQGAFVNFEAKQTAPARLSPDGSRLFVVNTPDARLSVFDVTIPLNPVLIAEIPVGLEPVSVNPRDNDEAWVVNEVSDSVSVVSVSRHAVTDTIYVKDEPADVVFAGGRAFISVSRNNRITVVDAASHAVVTNIPVFGENPRALAVSLDGTKVYAAFALSGNRTTIIPFDRAPLQPTNGMKAGLPPPPRVSLIVDATDPAWAGGGSPFIRFTMLDNDVVEINSGTLAISRHFPRVGTVNLGLAVRPGSGDLYVANTDARNTTRFEPVIRGAFVTNQVSRVDIASGAVTRFNLNPAAHGNTNFPSLPDLTNALAQPTALAFNPGGAEFWVAAFGSDRVALVDADSGAVLARVELSPTAIGSAADPRNKRGPRGLALKAGQALYVANRIANSLTVVDPVSRAVVRELPIGSHDPTPAAIRQGRGFLYDAKLSGAGLVSCASCHIDGDMDLLAWDLGNPQGDVDVVTARVSGLGVNATFNMHPMKGPMTTQTLRGLPGVEPLHWRGDRTNFLHFNGAFDGLMGTSILPAADMQAYRAFINTMVFQPNPNQNLDRTLPASFAGANPVAGRLAYLNTNYQSGALGSLRCNTCHAVPTGTDRSFTPAAALQEPQDFKVPHLRNIYQKMTFTNAPGAQSLGGFGIIHDGSDPSLFAFLSRAVFGVFANDAVVKNNLSAFVQCFDTGTAPAVGYARTLTAANVNNAAVSNDWSLLEAQAGLVNNVHLGTNGISQTNIDLIVKGTLDGRQRGFVYQPATANYRPDTTNMASMTRAQLRDKVLAGDVLTVIGVPFGTGVRAGINRNLAGATDPDGALDGDAPRPVLRIAGQSGGAVVAWPTNAPGFVLEGTPGLSPPVWTPHIAPRGVTGGEFTVTNAPATNRLFFRLREL
jgi:YVTN family beta-propeller protein